MKYQFCSPLSQRLLFIHIILRKFANPTNGETNLSIESDSKENCFDETAEWDLEVYNQTQELKGKVYKLKGKEHKIQTAGWIEGVYIVRVKYNNEILQGKLVVKK